MLVTGVKQNKLAKLSSNDFLNANNELWGKNLWLRAITEANFKSEIK